MYKNNEMVCIDFLTCISFQRKKIIQETNHFVFCKNHGKEMNFDFEKICNQ